MFRALVQQKMPAFPLTLLIFLLTALTALAGDLHQQRDNEARFARIIADQAVAPDFSDTYFGSSECVNGDANGFACDKVDLLAQLPLSAIGGGGNGADAWGWTDPQDGTEYGIVARANGTAFLDLSDPTDPIYLGNLPTNAGSNVWRDVKVHNNYAFIVADNVGAHGMQVFDLTTLRNVPNPPMTFTANAIYNGNSFGSAHNIAINEESGFGYIVGGDCSGGLHIVNLNNPLNPGFASCYTDGGYVHDAQCVTYVGPDPDYQGAEVCFNASGFSGRVEIVDVSNKSNPTRITQLPYSGSGYSHQGWLSEDHTTYFHGDEFDESNFGHGTRTRIFDVTDLDNPILIDTFDNTTTAIDHNMYVKDGLMYQANYRAGMRILDVSNPNNVHEVAYFDTYNGDGPAFNSAWTAYPYFESGIVLISDYEKGMFVVKPRLAGIDTDSDVSLANGLPGETVVHDIDIINTGFVEDTYSLTLSETVWDTQLSTNSVTVPANDRMTINVMVTIPESISLKAILPANDSFTLTITSDNDNTVTTTVNGTTTSAAEPGITLANNSLTQGGITGEIITYEIQVTNTGNFTDTYGIEVSNSNWLVSAPTEVTVGIGETVAVVATVTIGDGTNDTASLTFTSAFDEQTQATVTLNSYTRLLYFPLLQN